METWYFEIWSEEGYSIRSYNFPSSWEELEVIEEVKRLCTKEGLTNLRILPISYDAYAWANSV